MLYAAATTITDGYREVAVDTTGEELPAAQFRALLWSFRNRVEARCERGQRVMSWRVRVHDGDSVEVYTVNDVHEVFELVDEFEAAQAAPNVEEVIVMTEELAQPACVVCMGTGTTLDPSLAGLSCQACQGSGKTPRATAPLVDRIRYAAHLRDSAALAQLEAEYLKAGGCETVLSEPMIRYAKHNAGTLLTDEARTGQYALIVYLLGVYLDAFNATPKPQSLTVRFSPADDWRLRALMNPHMLDVDAGRKAGAVSGR